MPSTAIIVVREVKLTDEYTIECKLDYPHELRKFFTSDTFTASYNKDISAVPESILSISLLANLAPAAWALGADIHLQEVDGAFLKSLGEVKAALQAMYPAVTFSGEIVVEQVIDTPAPASSTRSAMLFSGGVDSTTSYILNKDANLSLVTVWGADIKLHQEDAWELVKQDNENFGKKNGRDNLFIKANLRGFLNEAALNEAFEKKVGLWWGNVQHGLGLIGLCAPVTFTQGLNTVYIPATHTDTFSQPWGSHPTIDNHVKWAGAKAVHHGYELSRQQKMAVIANYTREVDPALQIRACYSSTNGANCSRCEKCARTIAGLLVAGADPNRSGFNVSADTLAQAQDKFNRGTWKLADNEAFMWGDIKDGYFQKKTNVPTEYRFFFDWLAESDYSTFLQNSETNNLRKAKKLARKILPARVFSTLQKLR